MQDDVIFMQSFLNLNERSSKTVDHAMDVMLNALMFIAYINKHSPNLIQQNNINNPEKLTEFLSALL